MKWIWITLLACCYGFFRDFRPSEAYLTRYLTSDWKNLTLDQVNSDIYPWRTYSYVVWLIPVFVLTDYYRYKPMLILDAFVYILTWALLVWVTGIPAMTCMQVLYGLGSAAEVGYQSYLYAMVERKHFRKVTSIVRFSTLMSKFAAYLVGQLFVSFDVMDLRSLNVISFSSCCLAFCVSLILPKVKSSKELEATKEKDGEIGNVDSKTTKKDDKSQKSSDSQIYTINHRINATIDITKEKGNDIDEDCEKDLYLNNNKIKSLENEVDEFSIYDSEESTETDSSSEFSENGHAVRSNISCYNLKRVIKHSYSSRSVIIWSLWWIFASYGNFQTSSYIQDLWKTIADESGYTHSYNGAVEAAGMLLGSICVGLVCFVPINWSSPGRSELFMTIVCGMRAAIYVIMSRTNFIWVAYVLYGCLRVINQVSITIEFAEIAKALPGPRYAFVFGCNMFVALVIESIFTAVVVDNAGFAVHVRTQFLVYGIYSLTMALVFGLVAGIVFWRHVRKKNSATDMDTTPQHNFLSETQVVSTIDITTQDDVPCDTNVISAINNITPHNNVQCETKSSEFITHL